jgi:hypothetical protein
MDPMSIEAPIHFGTVQGFVDGLDHLVRPCEHVVVPEAQHSESSRSQEIITSGIIGLLFDVLAAVEFDDDQAIQAGEVADVETDLMLAAKLETRQLSSAQATPEETFRICQVSSQASDMALHDEAEHSVWTKMWRDCYRCEYSSDPSTPSGHLPI